MPSYLLDTSVIVDLINDREERRNLIRKMVQPGDTMGCCTINVIEVYTGIRPGEEEITRDYFDRLFYYDVTKEIARWSGELRYEWARKGQTLSLADAAIAAIALSHGLTLLTGNRKHFPMPELMLYPLPSS